MKCSEYTAGNMESHSNIYWKSLLVHSYLHPLFNEMATEAAIYLSRRSGWNRDNKLITHLICGPGVVIGKQPGGGDGSALLAANLQRADHWDAVVVTCVQGKETGTTN